MTPLTVLTLILLGTSFAITFSLSAVIVVVLVIGDEAPRLAREFSPLVESFFLFTVMTAFAAVSFYTLNKRHGVRYWSQLATWAWLVFLGWHFWV